MNTENGCCRAPASAFRRLIPMLQVTHELILGLCESAEPAKQQPQHGNRPQLGGLPSFCRWGPGRAWMRMTDVCFSLSGQVGLIQLGQEQVLIQPLNSSQGQEHLVRRKWSLTPSPSPEAQIPGQLCKVLTGESGKQREWLTARACLTLSHIPRPSPLMCLQMYWNPVSKNLAFLYFESYFFFNCP